MKDRIEIETFLKDEMLRLGYNEKTVTLYITWLLRLKDFYPKKDLEEITFQEIKKFLDHQVAKGQVSASAINIAFHSSILLYNKIWNKDFDFEVITRPERTRSKREVLTEKEMIELIEAITNQKQKTIIALTYSAGLDISEVRTLKPADIDFHRNIIKVRDSKGKLRREAILSKYVRTLLQVHLKNNAPSKYLFEGLKPGVQYGTRTMQQVFLNGLTKAGITKKLTFKCLKYSYILHLENLGVPLITTLSSLGMNSSQSLEFFSEISSRERNTVNFSPLDKIFLQEKEEYPINVEYLEQSINLVTDKDERDYLIEALVCLNNGSLRAGIIFAWNAAILNMRNKCFKHGATTLNTAITRHEPKAKTISKLDDFAYIKDSTTLQVAQDLGEIDKGEKDALVNCLDLRNKCGHPGQYRPKPIKAASFLEELLTIVFKK